MSPDRTVRFGVNIQTSAQSGADLVAAAQHAEALGFDAVTVHRDVLHGNEPSFEMWTLLTWLAAHTTKIMLAPVVLALPHRHPAMLAKMAEALDRLAEGRLILVLGS
jgi:alkanesulfonate monooxygenase SsuD/methylene tetrahydromethanopterin reductase-like flavin-dependent oxidoreductase (luciferase family)